MKKVVYHELGHLEHDSNQYKRRHEQFELQANRNMIRLLLEEELRESDYEFNYVNFMQRHHIEHKARPIEISEILKKLHIGNTDYAPKVVLTHHKRKAEEHKNNGSYAEVHKVFHNDITGVFCPCKACFDHCKSAFRLNHFCKRAL